MSKLIMESDIKLGVFIEIIVVIPIQYVDFTLIFRFFPEAEEKEVVVVFGVVEVGSGILDEGFPCLANRGASYDGFYG